VPIICKSSILEHVEEENQGKSASPGKRPLNSSGSGLFRAAKVAQQLTNVALSQLSLVIIGRITYMADCDLQAGVCRVWSAELVCRESCVGWRLDCCKSLL